MSDPSADIHFFKLGALLRGEADASVGNIQRWTVRHTLHQVMIIAIGAGAFGGAMGCWRAPEQAIWSALKLPLILLATAGGNTLINGMLAPLLGINLCLRESFAVVLVSFALAAAILGAFSPLMLFLAWNLPKPLAGAAQATAGHGVMLLTLVGMIAFAGVTANVRLLGLLRRLGGGVSPALKLLMAWLTVNLLLGSQLSWIARPFIGRADRPVRFLDPQALNGNFFEEVAKVAGELWTHFFR
jgi:hypothetical protein